MAATPDVVSPSGTDDAVVATSRGEATGLTTRMSADARRAQLIEVGWQLLQSRPIHELPLDEVAAAAGISRTLLFHYFPTKADFYFAVVSTMGEQLLRPPRLPGGTATPDRIRSLVDGFVRLVERNRLSYTALVRGAGGGDQRIVQLIADTRDALVPRWLDAAGCVDPSPLTTLIVRGWLVGMEETVIAWNPQEVPREALIDHLTESFLAELTLAEGRP